MNAQDSNRSGISGSSFDRWVQDSNMPTDSAITKMQHHFWVTRQTLSQKLGKKDDECIIASDAELDAKLELFRSIQESCFYLQRVIDRYQERLCNLAQEEHTMGRFLKEAGKQDKTKAGKIMSTVGKSMSYSSQQRMALRAPLIRLYQEVETFRQRAIEDTLQNIHAMERARTEYRAALSWMKNISQELDPDTSKQLEKFRKVQTRVRQGKTTFDHLALDCLQKVDLLAAARCSMFSHALVLYQNTLLSFTKRSAQAYSTIANSFKGYQHYDFTIVQELAETSSELTREIGDIDKDDEQGRFFFETEYHDDTEKAEEAKPMNSSSRNKINDVKLIDIEDESNNILKSIDSTSQQNGISQYITRSDNKLTDSLFNDTINNKLPTNVDKKASENIENNLQKKLEKHLASLESAINSFSANNSDFDVSNFNFLSLQDTSTQSLPEQTREDINLLDDIFNQEQSLVSNWDIAPSDTFLPANILKQSLGDAMLGIGRNDSSLTKNEMKVKNKEIEHKSNSWLDLFAELDPLTKNPAEDLYKGSNASV